MKKWIVMLDGETIDEVYFLPEITADEVRQSLISHDFYDARIVVKAG